jgi:hypothetical protein
MENQTTDYFAVAIIGLIAGTMGGLLGIGGAIIIIPSLIYFLGYNQQDAQGTTLLMLSLPVGALGAYEYYKSGTIDFKVALILAICFFISGFIGAKIAHSIPQDILKRIFAVLLILIALKMLFIDK